MTRKQFKTIQNITAQHSGRNEAKVAFSNKAEFKRAGGNAWMHMPTATLFVL